mmetsp:Transcript_13855/g.29200  ORF Transcript_13855/g.29200 Transcript_13855/m.29200 type:complete len:212 (+) Transcript_13855:1259-1894(+)
MVSQDREPAEHRPKPVLLPDVRRACAEGLLSADDVAAPSRARARSRQRHCCVHQVAEELPARRCLEERETQSLRDPVQRARGWHRAGERLEPAVREPRQHVRVRRDDRNRVRWGDEAPAAENHVAVGVAVRRGAEDGCARRVGGFAAICVEPHQFDKLRRVRKIRIWVPTSKIGLGLAVAQAASVDAKGLLEDGARVRPRHAVHRVERKRH